MPRLPSFAAVAAAFAVCVAVAQPSSFAQPAALADKVAAVKAAMAKNQQMLAQYQWQMQQTVSVNGDVKNVTLYQVQMGPDGKPVKVDISQSASSDRRKFGIRHRIAQDYADYGKQIASLAASYAQLDPGRLQQLYAQGNVSMRSGGAPDLDAIVITNDVKPGDSVTLVFNRTQKAIVSLNVASYLSDKSDVVTIAALFARLPDGTNHVATSTVVGQSKNLTVQDVNSAYQKRS